LNPLTLKIYKTVFKRTFIINLKGDIYYAVLLVYTMNSIINYQVSINKHQLLNLIPNVSDGVNKFDNLVVLSVWNEFKGICVGFEIIETSIHIHIEDKVLNISKTEAIINLFESQDIVGKRIGILRTDIPNKDYLVRLLEEWE